ncbi:uncharacterized protein LOC118760996 [Octopus sinensis]|uniref:Uncharacterized protein LOC118760996 n=1 Tax=Octopus sinensis TaxID=2607531 RepID=A0A7E6EGZ6_9MOLL|nr:uncharacterized protein LOC118760996 [Octopus sinensis]
MAATVLRGRNSLETTSIYVLLASCICLSLTQPTVRQIRFSGDGCFGRIKWPHHPFRRFHREWKNLVESVLIEVKRQTNENNELRHEVEQLRNTSAQYKQLLMDLASNVNILVKTLVGKEQQQQYQKQQKQPCSCESIVDNAELESMASVTLNPDFAVDEDNNKKKPSSRYANRIIEDNTILSNYGSGGNDLRKSKVESPKSPTTDTYNDGPITRQFLINGSYPKGMYECIFIYIILICLFVFPMFIIHFSQHDITVCN